MLRTNSRSNTKSRFRVQQFGNLRLKSRFRVPSRSILARIWFNFSPNCSRLYSEFESRTIADPVRKRIRIGSKRSNSKIVKDYVEFEDETLDKSRESFTPEVVFDSRSIGVDTDDDSVGAQETIVSQMAVKAQRKKKIRLL
ncbi:hypothetical protein E3N88_18318 [Mikania micrantha]|uniref:Uncharacterized protein n=1 Tax=Mikania micrantha TaxID=192012 RepID=A0A5N6NUB1_9ASTR|nr:hypothetical protein E3N88_18318 [Mikania micrantha]